MTDIAGISVVGPSADGHMHFLVRYADGSFQRKDIHPVHALRLVADLANGAAFQLGKEKD